MDSRECFIPALRFTGFEDCWKEYRLGDFSQSIKRVVSDTQVHIMMITAQNGFINQSDRYSFNNAGESLKKYIELHKGELAYNHGASKLRPFGSCFSLQIDKARIPFVYHCFSIKENDPEFISLVLNNKNTEGQLRKIVTSGARMDGLLNISFEQYCSLNLKIPSLKEQQVIADFFKSLDSMITLTSKKIEKLKQALTGCMQTMFPLEGELEPKIRFKGFEGEWEKVKFSELYEPSSIKNKTYGPEKIISVANMYFKPVSYISNDDYLKSYNVMNLGDIAFEGNKSKNYAHGRFVENFIGNGIVSHVFIVLKPKSKQYDLQFWRYLINYEGIMGPILLRSTKHSTMMTDLVVGDFLKEYILVPSYTEQKEIGAYFNNLDTLIALQTKRLDLLKHIKSACLDNMFV